MAGSCALSPCVSLMSKVHLLAWMPAAILLRLLPALCAGVCLVTARAATTKCHHVNGEAGICLSLLEAKV